MLFFTGVYVSAELVLHCGSQGPMVWVLLFYLGPFVHLIMNFLGFNSSRAEPSTVSQISEAGVQQRLL